MPSKTPPKTNATRLLDNLDLAYELLAYKPGSDLSANAAADLLGLPRAIVYKTILARGNLTGPLFACLSAERELDLKALAIATGDKKITLVAVKELQILTGYVRGGCSPLGALKKFPVYLDEAILGPEKIAINAGAKGRLILIRPEDLLVATRGTLAVIAKKI
ncbi:MAG: aminoacyl-tRNA deacylase [Deltaproteobacteria bacterium]|jgi:Cys-tRNA(Pro)/Cys-tRNA(Cys) deacylase|nr:aminoacyl-tRNA deacylase [Deltaproteobacteria bacterium]